MDEAVDTGPLEAMVEFEMDDETTEVDIVVEAGSRDAVVEFILDEDIMLVVNPLELIDEAALVAIEAVADRFEAAVDAVTTGWILYISSRQPPPQYSLLSPAHGTLQSVIGWTPLPALGAVPQ